MFLNRKIETFDIVVGMLLGIVFIICIFPILHVFSVSISDPSEVVKGIGIIPQSISLFAYEYMLKTDYIVRSFFNSLNYTLTGTAISMVMTVIAAYPLAKRRLVGNKILNLMIVITFYFNGGMIPTYLLIKDLHMRNTMWAMVLPGAIFAFNFIIMRTSFADLPPELEESATIDGAGVISILLKIVIPMSKPVLAAMCLFYGVSLWNNYFSAVLYLSDFKKYPMTVILREVVMGTLLNDQMKAGRDAVMKDVLRGTSIDLFAFSTNFKYSMIFITIMPILIIYPFVQKYFVKGMMVGAVKG